MPKRLKKALNRLSRKRTGRSSAQDSPSQNNGDAQTAHAPGFLSIPPEIRNQIYEELSSDTTLTLTSVKDRKTPLPVGLLLACKQTRREYKNLLLSNAQILVSVSDYNFSNLVRVLEKLKDEDISAIKLNSQLWVLLHISHVPSRDDRRNLRGWCDYRDSESDRPYFGPGRKAGNEVKFEYDVRFGRQVRPPRPMSRYANGYQMKLDLLRSHLRMYRKLESPADVACSKSELKHLQRNIGECVELFEELESQRDDPPLRSMSVSTVATTMSNAHTVSSTMETVVDEE